MNEITLFEILENHAASQPDAISYMFLDGEGEAATLTFSRLLQRVKAIAARLQEDHAPGERVLLMYQPGLDFIEAMLACFAAGVVAVPVQPMQNRRVLPKLTGIMRNAGCRLLLTNSSSQQTLQRILPDAPMATAGVQWLCTDTIDSKASACFRKPELEPTALAFLQYTSGSTGEPKGVMVSHRNLLNNLSVMQSAFEHGKETVVASWLPFYHDMGLIGNVLQAVYLGAPAVLFAPMTFLLSPITWLRAISDWRVSFSGAPSFAYELCVNRIQDHELAGIDLSSWRVAFNGAEPVKAQVIEAFTRKFAPYGFRAEAFYPCYGMAETTLFVSGGKPAAKALQLPVDAELLARNVIYEKKSSSTVLVGCGHAHGGHEVKVVAPDSFDILADGQVGEIWVAGPSVAAGYWDKPELSAAIFQAHATDGSGPYLRTGDLGFLYRDELFVTGRLKDLIIVRGQNHYPSDLEATTADSHHAFKPGGAAAFVVNDEGDTKLIMVAEMQRQALSRLDQQLQQTIFANARKAISDAHGLSIADLVLIKPSTLPKTSSGKVQRGRCRDLYLQGKLERVALQAKHVNTEASALAELV